MIVVGQATEAVEVFNRTASEFGIVAALLVVTLCFVGFVFWRFGSAFVETQREAIKRIADAMDRSVDGSLKTAETLKAMEGELRGASAHLVAVDARQQRQFRAWQVALTALTEEDPKERHRLIDQAKRILEVM